MAFYPKMLAADCSLQRTHNFRGLLAWGQSLIEYVVLIGGENIEV